MKFYTEISSNGIESLFKLLDEEKAEILQDKNASDSQKAINEYCYRNILNQINNILLDTTSKNEELIKDQFFKNIIFKMIYIYILTFLQEFVKKGGTNDK